MKMKHITDYITERKGDPLDEQWLNDEGAVMTKDGRQAIITKIDYEEVPNVIYGQVKMGEDLYEYQWLETGECLKALDKFGNPKKTNENDILVKAN